MAGFIVDYKTIKGMRVELPREFNGYQLVSAFAEAYVELVFSQSILVSDECLIRSIGSDAAKEALLLGISQRFTPRIAEVFTGIAEEKGLWECCLLQARHGNRKGREIFLREFSGYEPEVVEAILKLS